MKWAKILDLPQSLGRRVLAREIIANINTKQLSSYTGYLYRTKDGKCRTCAIGAAHAAKCGFSFSGMDTNGNTRDFSHDSMKEMGWTTDEINIMDYVFEGTTHSSYILGVEAAMPWQSMRKHLASILNRDERLLAIWTMIYNEDSGKLQTGSYIKREVSSEVE
jgi:hypothetical protein